MNYPEARTIIDTIWAATPADPNPANDFVLRTKKLQEELRCWHLNHFKNSNEEMEGCKEKILELYQKEERQPLSLEEFRERVRMRERVFELVNVTESRWRQRARCKWLREGDKNTRYFHAQASARCRKNRVEAVRDKNGRVVTGTKIKYAFLRHLSQTLGQADPTMQFLPETMYATNTQLSNLDALFSYQEVTLAVKALALNKASGPDGLTAEFMQKIWGSLSRGVMQILH